MNVRLKIEQFHIFYRSIIIKQRTNINADDIPLSINQAKQNLFHYIILNDSDKILKRCYDKSINKQTNKQRLINFNLFILKLVYI